MKRMLQRMLSRHPGLYLRVLRAAGRGSMEKRLFLALLRNGDVIFDIGANRGEFTSLFSDIAGSSGKIHAFEPVPGTFNLLKTHMAAARCAANFQLNNLAVADFSGPVTLHLPGNDDGQASIQQHTKGSWQESPEIHRHECRATTLDRYTAELPRLDFIKCDVEGAEIQVIRGGRSTLERLSPLLFLEVNPDWLVNFDHTPEDLIHALQDLGYDTFWLAGETLRPLPREGFSTSENLLCAQSKLHSQRLHALEIFFKSAWPACRPGKALHTPIK